MKKLKKTAAAVKNAIVGEKSLLAILSVPVLFATRFFVREVMDIIPFSWEELTAMSIVGVVFVVIFFIFLREDLQQNNATVITLSVLTLFLNDLLGNKINNQIIMMFVWAFIVILVLFFVLVLMKIKRREGGDTEEVATETIRHGIIFVGIFVLGILIKNIVMDFGTQWIWIWVVPAVLICVFLFTQLGEAYATPDFIEEKVIPFVFFLTAIAGVVSTIFQFWDTIVLGYPVWQILSALVTVFLIYTLFSNIIAFRKRKKTEEEKRLLKEQEEIERKKRSQEMEEENRKREEERKALRKSLSSKNSFEKDDFRKAMSYGLIDGDKRLSIKMFLSFDLMKLFIISKGHQKIFWDGWTQKLFRRLHTLLMEVKDDVILYKLSSKIVTLSNKLDKYAGFEGYDLLMKNANYIPFQNLVNDAKVIYERLKKEYGKN